jgi:anaerobic magnesium-protoporphyrin IX monomethyl ester cyclase
MSKKKLNITLVRGPLFFKEGAVNNEATTAIGMAYIDGFLRLGGYETTWVDAIAEGLNEVWAPKRYPGYNCQGLTFDEIVNRIPESTEVIGFSGMFSGEWPIYRDLINQVRRKFPYALFVGGGEHFTSLPEYSLRDCPALDICVLGEGEQTFYNLLEAYTTKRDFKELEGVAFIDSSNTFFGSKEAPPRIRKIDEIGWPYWPENYLEKFWSAGKSYGVTTERDMPFLVSRGCPYRCTFCSSPQMWTTRYILRDVEDAIKEIKFYIKKYNITSLQFYDLTAITKKSWIVEFCRRMIEEKINIKWSLPSGTRSEVLDREVLELLSKTGCNYLVYAPESASPETLVQIKKKIHLSQMEESIFEAKRQKIVVRTNLIIGFPHETWVDIFKTLAFGVKMAVKGVDEVPVFIFSPYPGTEIFHNLFEHGSLKIEDDYFLQLTSLNSDYLSWDVVSSNSRINWRVLGFVRTVFILTNYFISYIFHPLRIFRTIKNIFSENISATVFEHRLKDMLKRKKASSSLSP